MSLVQYNTFNLMNQDIIPPLSTDLMLEEKAINDLLETARTLANRYHNPYRWPLDKEEIFGELGLEIAKAVNKYLYCKMYSEYLNLGRKMLWNRARELLSQAYGTRRNVERTAQSVPEENEDLAETYDMISDFLDSDYYVNLSELAKKVVNIILDPDDKLHEAILEHINYRNKLYKSGGGINGIPAKVVAKALDLSVSKIKEIYIEISEAINKEVVYMTEVTTGSKQYDFANTLVTWEDYLTNGEPTKYIRWSLVDLENQAKFRGVYEEGMKRSQVIQALQADDTKSGRKSDSEVPLFAKQAEESKETIVSLEAKELLEQDGADIEEDEFEKLPVSGNIHTDLSVEDINIMKKAKEDIMRTNTDDDFGPRRKTEITPETEPITFENKETDFSEFSKDLAAEEGFIENVEEETEPAKDLTLTEETTLPADSNVMVFARLLEAMKQGDTLRVTKLSSNEWSINVEPYAISNAEAEKFVTKLEEWPSRKTVVKKKKSDIYIEAISKLKAMSDEQLVGYAKSTDLVWKEAENSKINRMRITMAHMKKNGIEKYE